MGKKDTITKEYMKNPEVFSDAFNLFLYHGRQEINPEQLREVDTAEIAVPYGAEGAGIPEQRYRDVLKLLTMMTDGETAFCILGIESQADIHYAMPVRNGLYDFLQLSHQVAEATRGHRRAGAEQTAGEYLGGFWRTDRLLPVVTLVIYFGADEWDAPLTLKEMYACADEDILSYAADYHVNLLAPLNMTDEEIALFRSGLREVMQYIKCSGDQEKIAKLMEGSERFRRLDRETAEVINAVTNSKLQFRKKEEEVNMCKALDDIREGCRNEGRAEGRAEGRIMYLVTLVCRMIAKGRPPEAIAEDLEEDYKKIKCIYDIAVRYAPNYDTEKIYAQMRAQA